MLERIKKLFSRTREVSPLYDEPPLATTLTVTRLHDILDSARNGDVTPLFTLYRDVVLSNSHIQAEFAKRKLAVIGDECVLLPADADNSDEATNSELLEPLIFNVPGWLQSCVHLLDSTLWPVAIVEKVFAPADLGPIRFTLAELRPVPHHLIDLRKGDLRLYDVDQDTGRPLLTSQPVDPERYIVHRGHMLSVADTHGGPMRSILFWFLFASLGRDWWARFVDRLGAPIIIGKYPAGDDEAKRVIKQAMAAFNRTHGLSVTDSTSLEMVQAGAQSGENYEKFITLCHHEISKLILGQTLSSEAQNTGLGSGVATSHDSVRRDIRRMDALRLADTIRSQLLTQLVAINGLRGNAPVLRWVEDTDEDAARYGKLLVDIRNAGYEVDDDDLPNASRRIGLKLRRAAREVGAPGVPFLA